MVKWCGGVIAQQCISGQNRYWMYAAAKAGGSGLLVSNDEMRDHIFKLLAPKFFKRWKSRHQVKFGFAGPRRFQAEYPAPFSTAAQVSVSPLSLPTADIKPFTLER